jgi:catalase
MPEITDVRIARCALLFALLATGAFAAEVYRSTAPDGTVSYSDRPQGPNSEFVVVNTPHAGPRTAQAQGPASGGGNAANNATPPEAPAAPVAPTGPTAAQLRAERQKNCDIAREREQRYTVSRRLYRTNANGEREYLDDRQIDEARAKAAADVKDWCG